MSFEESKAGRSMVSRHDGAGDRRAERPSRGRRPRGEEAVWLKADCEPAEEPSPKGPGEGLPSPEIEDQELDVPLNPRLRWLPPALR